MKEFGPCVPVKVTGNTAGQETLALIATGADGSYIDLEDAARMGLRPAGEHRSRNRRMAWRFPRVRRFDGDTRAGRHHRPAPSWVCRSGRQGPCGPRSSGRMRCGERNWR